jgi:hypothetical protein
MTVKEELERMWAEQLSVSFHPQLRQPVSGSVLEPDTSLIESKPASHWTATFIIKLVQICNKWIIVFHYRWMRGRKRRQPQTKRTLYMVAKTTVNKDNTRYGCKDNRKQRQHFVWLQWQPEKNTTLDMVAKTTVNKENTRYGSKDNRKQREHSNWLIWFCWNLNRPDEAPPVLNPYKVLHSSELKSVSRW